MSSYTVTQARSNFKNFYNDLFEGKEVNLIKKSTPIVTVKATLNRYSYNNKPFNPVEFKKVVEEFRKDVKARLGNKKLTVKDYHKHLDDKYGKRVS